MLVWVVGARAEGLGMRAVARVFEVDPNTVLAWLVEVAAHLQAFSHHCLHDVHGNHVQLDALFVLLSTVKAGEVSDRGRAAPVALVALGVDRSRSGQQAPTDGGCR